MSAMRPLRILELRSVHGTGGGPEKTIMLGAARSDSRRFVVTVAYIRDARDPVFGAHAAKRRLAVDYVEVTERHSFDPTIVRELRALVRSRQIDIVHAHDYKTDFLALLLARYENVVPLATAHGWTGHLKRERFVYYPLDKLLLRAFPRVISVSGEIARTLTRGGVRHERVLTILNGIDHRAFRRDPSRESAARRDLGFQQDDFVIGAVGRLEPQKRFDILIDACARVRDRYPAVRLIIAGDGSLRSPLEKQVARLFPDGRCQLLGHRTDVDALHHGMDLLVQSSDYEGTPNVVLEAMAFGTPVVATSVGGTDEIVRDGVDGLLLPSGSPERLAASIEKAIADPDGRQARARAARLRVERELSFDARQNKLEAVYEELAGERRFDERPADTMRSA
jgi:glycosyltransferase involved in cell wall biosynthesis